MSEHLSWRFVDHHRNDLQTMRWPCCSVPGPETQFATTQHVVTPNSDLARHVMPDNYFHVPMQRSAKFVSAWFKLKRIWIDREANRFQNLECMGRRDGIADTDSNQISVEMDLAFRYWAVNCGFLIPTVTEPDEYTSFWLHFRSDELLECEQNGALRSFRDCFFVFGVTCYFGLWWYNDELEFYIIHFYLLDPRLVAVLFPSL